MGLSSLRMPLSFIGAVFLLAINPASRAAAETAVVPPPLDATSGASAAERRARLRELRAEKERAMEAFRLSQARLKRDERAAASPLGAGDADDWLHVTPGARQLRAATAHSTIKR